MSQSAYPALVFTFDSFYTELKLNEGVEDALAALETRYSYLKTLKDGYSIYLKKHKEFLVKHLSNLLSEIDDKWLKFQQELADDYIGLKDEVDIINICEKYNSFTEKVLRWRSEKCEEREILRNTALIKKKNLELLRRIHPHTQEYCLRLMNAAEEMRERKRNFPREMEDNIIAFKADLTRMIVKKFQLARIEKLKEVCRMLKTETDAKHARKIMKFKEVLERLRVSQEKMRKKEIEKNKLLAELKSLPSIHKNNQEDMARRNENLKMKLANLEQKTVEMNKQIKSAVIIVEQEKRRLLEERSKLQTALAKEKALLCQVVKHCKIHGLDITFPDMSICKD